MTIVKTKRLTDIKPTRVTPHDPHPDTGFTLTPTDRLGIEQLLARQGPQGALLSPLLAGLLRVKLRTGETVSGSAPGDLVTARRLITYMTSGGGAKSGILTMTAEEAPGEIPVGSLLGATLIGMRRLQKAPLLHEGGEISFVAVLQVDDLDEGATTV